MSNKTLSVFVVITIMFFSTTSCSYTPVFTHKINIKPKIEENVQGEVVSTQIRLRLESVISEVAEDHGLELCPWYPKILTPKSEMASYCMPDEGVHTLWVNAKQYGSTFRIRVNDSDRGALFIASESERLRIIWHDLLQRLKRDFPYYKNQTGETYFSITVCKDRGMFIRENCIEIERLFQK